MCNYKFNRKRVLIFIVMVLFLLGMIMGSTYYVQGKTTLDWAAPRIVEEHNMTYVDDGFYRYLLSTDIVNLKNTEKIVDDPELTISADDAACIAEEFIKKYCLNGRYKYKIDEPQKRTYSIYSKEPLYKYNCYEVWVKLDRKKPSFILNDDIRKKNYLIIWIDNNGVFEISYI